MCLRSQGSTCMRKAKTAASDFKNSLIQHQEVKKQCKGKREDKFILQEYKGVMRATRGTWDKA